MRTIETRVYTFDDMIVVNEYEFDIDGNIA